MDNHVEFVNGKFVSREDAVISVRDLGFLRGYGLCDVLTVFNGKPFLHDDHWDRFERGSWELGLHLPISREDHVRIIETLLLKNNQEKKDCVIRTVLSGGISEDGISLENKETLCVLLEKRHTPPLSVYEKGATLETFEHKRTLPLVKSTNYLIPLWHRKRFLKEKDVLEILYTSEGYVLEAATSNIALVKNNVIFCPKEDVLGGITRLYVLRLARQEGYDVREQSISIQELFDADEVFLMASNKAVVPIVTIDGKTISDGKVGKVTTHLLHCYREAVAEFRKQ